MGKIIKLKVLTFLLIWVSLASCSKDEDFIINSFDTTSETGDNSGNNGSSGNNGTNSSTLETYLKANADYVHNINGFYIVGSAANPTAGETTAGTTGKDIFEHSVRLFSSFLDQNNDGVIDTDKQVLNQNLANKMLFISGPLTMVDKISFASQVEGKGLYGMSMQTDNWPYMSDYNGKGWSVSILNSSTWRPQVFNALWEEVFHTLTEAYSRVDNEFRFTTGGYLRTQMDNDISAGTYDISVQNTEENGNYDKVTAVNEYIHQIWAINFAGQSSVLNTHQKNALNFMISKGVPMQVNANYTQMLGVRVK